MAVTTKQLYHCRSCNAATLHRHLHDTAHGIEGTHMTGSERFVCSSCLLSTSAQDEGASDFPFILDIPIRRETPPSVVEGTFREVSEP